MRGINAALPVFDSQGEIRQTDRQTDRARPLPICSCTGRINWQVRRFSEVHVFATRQPLLCVTSKQTSFPTSQLTQVYKSLLQMICVCQEKSARRKGDERRLPSRRSAIPVVVKPFTAVFKNAPEGAHYTNTPEGAHYTNTPEGAHCSQ